MILLADSGGSKTDWRLYQGKKLLLAFRTRGYNPMFHNVDAIYNDFKPVIEEAGFADSLKELYFYGAGCSTDERAEIVNQAMRKIFPKAKIFIHHDMLGAGIAAWGAGEGLVGILGTGSNCCFYAQGEIKASSPSWGFLFGDEGGGADLGKHLFQDYFKENLPLDLKEALEVHFQKDKNQFLDEVYQSSAPNKVLASIAPFIAKYADHPYVNSLLKSRFQAYLDSFVKLYPQHKTHGLKMIGSIAKYFYVQLKEVCQENGVDLKEVVDQPIEGISKYHCA